MQEVRAATTPRDDPTALLSVRALLLAGAFPLIPPDKVPRGVSNPGALYGDFTPVTLMQGVGEAGQAALQLGTAAFKAVGRALGRDSSSGEGGGSATENGAHAPDGGGRPGSAPPVAPSPTAAAGASAGAKPRRQAPPPPPKA